MAKEKVTKEKGHPVWRCPPIHGRPVREAGLGFSTRRPALSKRNGHPCPFPLRGLFIPTSPPLRGPGRAPGHPGPDCSEKLKSKSKSEEPHVAALRFAVAVAVASAVAVAVAFDLASSPSAHRMCALLFRGPFCSGGRVEEKPEGWPAWMPASLASAQARAWMPELRQRRSGCPMPCRQTPEPDRALCGHGCPQSA